MIKAILLDLDDTLLGNPPDTFMRGYMGMLRNFLGGRLGTDDRVLQGLKTGVMAVARSRDPYASNWDTFFAAFEPVLTVERAAFDAAMDEFYRDIYPHLAATVQPRAAARPLVEGLLARGLRVAVATNPYFPRTAVEQRLAWAGVPVDEVALAHVTVLENSHFAKPDPAYFEEVLARLGVMPDEAVMVGDDWALDIAPAALAGLNTWWISERAPDPDGAGLADGWGPLEAFAAEALQGGWLESLQQRPLEPAQIAPRLTGNLAALMGVVHETPAHVWHLHPDADEWSPMEVLCHLRESEADVQRPRIARIVAEDNPFLSQPKAPPAPSSRVCPQDALSVALAFGAEREKTLALLAGLQREQWDRPARHYIFGPTTLLEMAQFTAQHDRLHLTQLCQTIGKCE